MTTIERGSPAASSHAMTTRAVALMCGGKIFDAFDGRWSSEYNDDVAA
jgi:hypothetical protein